MTEEEVLYAALKSPLGLVIKADKARLLKAKERLRKADPAIMGLTVLGPDRAGQLYIVRSLEARKALNEH